MRLYLAFFVTFVHHKNYNLMGRGDIKTKKGKIASGSFGKSRPAKPAAKKTATKKAATKK
ncbi:MAG TPA: 30S ribosomal protein THX [Ferruginibacter sp.]|nr:30S ribosomal protein THX [Ferruginibacter sp.]